MERSRDFEELFASLNAHGVKYLVVGAHALAHYVTPRFTRDLDLWIPPALNDPEVVRNAMKAFGVPVRGMTIADLQNPDMVFQYGVPPLRIDLLMGISGLTAAAAWKRRRKARYGRTPIWVLSRADLIMNKRASGRLKDLGDLETLGVRPRRKARNRRA